MTRYERGLSVLNQMNPESPHRIESTWAEIAPDLANFIIEFAYGDVLAREGLDLKTRSIAILASLVTRGDAFPQLRLHIDNALNVGCTRQEVVEVMLQMAVYAGFPAAINGMTMAKEVFAARDAAGKTDEAPQN